MVGVPMTDTLDCFPAGCPTCPHRTAGGGCRLMTTLARSDVVQINTGSGRPRNQHPIEAFA